MQDFFFFCLILQSPEIHFLQKDTVLQRHIFSWILHIDWASMISAVLQVNVQPVISTTELVITITETLAKFQPHVALWCCCLKDQ